MSKSEIHFEEAMKPVDTGQLRRSWELEKGDLDLDQSVARFEEGMKLSKKCSELLEDAEKRITIVLKDGNTVKEESFMQEEV